MARCALLLLAVLRLVACTIDEQLVVKARAAGLGTLLIATSFGCTQRRVQQILAAGGAPSAAAGAARTQRPQPSNELLVDMVEREIRRHGDYYGVQMLLGALRQWQPEYHFPRRAVAAAAATLRPISGPWRTTRAGEPARIRLHRRKFELASKKYCICVGRQDASRQGVKDGSFCRGGVNANTNANANAAGAQGNPYILAFTFAFRLGEP